jgi:formylglycine-generating enzyme
MMSVSVSKNPDDEEKMKKALFLVLFVSAFLIFPSLSLAKELPKIAVWDLVAGNITPAYAQDLTSILVSEITKLRKYEVYSQENVRTLAGWTAERMILGCTDSKCLTALGQMDIAKLISGRIGKIGNRYSISLNLFDTQNARAENAVSEFGRSEDELIDLVQVAVRKLLGIEVASSKEEKVPEKPTGTASPEYEKSFKDPVTGIEFVFVKGGCYEMGDIFGDGPLEEKPVHEVCVDDFYLGKYEVTQGQWEKVMESNPSKFKGRDYPVDQASWNDAQQFIERLNNQSTRKFRFPTEAEWEYAARSRGKRERYSGTNLVSELGQYAWYKDNQGTQTHPVGQKRPNELGLYDMTGNVWEWCADWYDKDYYKSSPKDNPKRADSGSKKVLRGGGWSTYLTFVGTTSRNSDAPHERFLWTGLRLALPAR